MDDEEQCGEAPEHGKHLDNRDVDHVLMAYPIATRTPGEVPG